MDLTVVVVVVISVQVSHRCRSGAVGLIPYRVSLTNGHTLSCNINMIVASYYHSCRVCVFFSVFFVASFGGRGGRIFVGCRRPRRVVKGKHGMHVYCAPSFVCVFMCFCASSLD